jgi:hypothetical protein
MSRKTIEKILNKHKNWTLTDKQIKLIMSDIDKEDKEIIEHLRSDIKESKKSIQEDKELERTLGRMK